MAIGIGKWLRRCSWVHKFKDEDLNSRASLKNYTRTTSYLFLCLRMTLQVSRVELVLCIPFEPSANKLLWINIFQKLITIPIKIESWKITWTLVWLGKRTSCDSLNKPALRWPIFVHMYYSVSNYPLAGTSAHEKHVSNGVVRDDTKLPDDSGEVSNFKWSGWRFDSQLWNLFSIWPGGGV